MEDDFNRKSMSVNSSQNAVSIIVIRKCFLLIMYKKITVFGKKC